MFRSLYDEVDFMKKIKIFAYIGSKKKDSNTLRAAQYFIDRIEKIIPVETEIHTSADFGLQECQGCCCCFNDGFCPMDKKDGFDKLKKHMLDADVILVGSPVYSASISGSMKIFMDRLSSWLHLMPFCGKPVIPVITASGNSIIETNTYMKKIAESWGGFVPFSVMCTVDKPAMLDSEEYRNKHLPKLAEELVSYLSGKRDIVSSKYQEMYFLNLRGIYLHPSNGAEYRYWNENNMLNCKSFSEMLSSRSGGARI